MEVTVQNLVYNPARDGRSTNCSHLFSTFDMSILVHVGLEPGRDSFPFRPNVEGEIFDISIETSESVRILAVIQRRTRLGESLVSERVLKLLNL